MKLIPRELYPVTLLFALVHWMGSAWFIALFVSLAFAQGVYPPLCPWLWQSISVESVQADEFPTHDSHSNPFSDEEGFTIHPDCLLSQIVGGTERDNDDGDSWMAIVGDKSAMPGKIVFRGLGFDTPETKKSLEARREVQMHDHQCDEKTLDWGAWKARELARQFLAGGFITYTNNKSPYNSGRLWAVVWFETDKGWVEIGEYMVAVGLARVIRHPTCPAKRLENLLRLQKRAQLKQIGLWENFKFERP